MTLRLLIGSTSAGKIGEYRALLRGIDLELLDPTELPERPAEPAEDAPSYAENATHKALAYARATGIATVADDSGLEVEALGGAPGLRSRRYFGLDVTAADRNRMLLALLDGVTERAARFVCVIALGHPDGRVERFDGEVRGAIGLAPRGDAGFGYDPLFVIAGDGRTMAELPAAEKNAISHRGRAAAKLRAALAEGAR